MRNGRWLLWVLAWALLPIRAGGAEPGVPVGGRVVDALSGTPVAGARVEAGGEVAFTGTDGTFSLTVRPGLWSLKVSAQGYTEGGQELRVAAGDVMPALELALIPRNHFRDAAEVTAGSAPSAPAVLPVNPVEVVTTAGGGENVFHTLQTLPGVAATDEFGSRLAVRGGGPDENLTVMDGVEVYNPYRLFGLTSAFNPEIIEGFQLHAGAFSAKYGDRLSSLLLVQNRAGTQTERLRGSSALSLTDGNVVAEGRLPASRGSWLVAGRRTYYDLIANAITGTDLPAFTDLQGRLVYDLRPGHRLSVFGLHSRESADAFLEPDDVPGEQVDFVTAVDNDVASLALSNALGTGASLQTIVAYNDNAQAFDVLADVRYTGRRSNAPSDDQGYDLANLDFARQLSVRDVSLRQELALRTSDRHLLEAGFEWHRLRTRVAWQIVGERNPTEGNGSSVEGGAGLPDELDSRLDSTRFGAWLQERLEAGPWTVEPGLRLDRSTVNSRTELWPRLSLTFAVDPATRLHGGGGVYTQSPGYEKLIQADYFLDLGTASPLASERAVHAMLGVERDLAGGVTARVDGYWKRFDRLIVGRLETEEERQARVAAYEFPPELSDSVPTEPIITDQPTNDGRGSAWGLEIFLLRRPASGARLTGWASYAYGVAKREGYGRTYPFDYDRRHALSLVANYRVNRWLDLATTTRVASGFPRTPGVGLKVAAQETQQDGRQVFVPMRDAQGLLVYEADYGGLADLNAARLPLFARVDFRATFHPKGPAGRWQIYLDVINVLNRDNAGQIEARLEYDPASDRPKMVEDRAAALPFLPSLGIRFRF